MKFSTKRKTPLTFRGWCCECAISEINLGHLLMKKNFFCGGFDYKGEKSSGLAFDWERVRSEFRYDTKGRGAVYTPEKNCINVSCVGLTASSIGGRYLIINGYITIHTFFPHPRYVYIIYIVVKNKEIVS